MASFFQMVLQTIKVFVIFTACTILFYYGIMWVGEEYQSYHRYDKPEGTAMKVSKDVMEEGSSLLDRLKLFYLNGE
jgi:hypothetical protein